jgi:ABC-2 type transport system ATP-binding protein
MTYGLERATVRFGDTVAVDDVTMQVEPGVVLAVVGGDGAGKSTALRALVGEVPLASGSASAPAKDQVGYLPASAGSWGALTVVQNMDFVGGAYGLAGAELAARRDALLDRAGLTAARDRPAAQLSGGMRRKLGFAMAVLPDPPLLVLDEPSTGVDPVSRVDLWRLVSQAAAAGTAVVMSTTYLDEAERAGRLLVLDRGRALAAGTLTDVLAAYPGVVTETDRPVRPGWAWRRGRLFHECWPDPGAVPPGQHPVTADLEDVVLALSLLTRAGEVAA